MDMLNSKLYIITYLILEVTKSTTPLELRDREDMLTSSKVYPNYIFE